MCKPYVIPSYLISTEQKYQVLVLYLYPILYDTRYVHSSYSTRYDIRLYKHVGLSSLCPQSTHSSFALVFVAPPSLEILRPSTQRLACRRAQIRGRSRYKYLYCIIQSELIFIETLPVTVHPFHYPRSPQSTTTTSLTLSCNRYLDMKALLLVVLLAAIATSALAAEECEGASAMPSER